MHAIITGDCAECGETALLFMVQDVRTEEHYGFCQVCIDDEFNWWKEWQRVHDLKLETKDEEKDS